MGHDSGRIGVGQKVELRHRAHELPARQAGRSLTEEHPADHLVRLADSNRRAGKRRIESPRPMSVFLVTGLAQIRVQLTAPIQRRRVMTGTQQHAGA